MIEAAFAIEESLGILIPTCGFTLCSLFSLNIEK
jgi:hypothetical protein